MNEEDYYRELCNQPWAHCTEVRCRYTCPIEDAIEDEDGFLMCPKCGCGMEA